MFEYDLEEEKEQEERAESDVLLADNDLSAGATSDNLEGLPIGSAGAFNMYVEMQHLLCADDREVYSSSPEEEARLAHLIKETLYSDQIEINEFIKYGYNYSARPKLPALQALQTTLSELKNSVVPSAAALLVSVDHFIRSVEQLPTHELTLDGLEGEKPKRQERDKFDLINQLMEFLDTLLKTVKQASELEKKDWSRECDEKLACVANEVIAATILMPECVTQTDKNALETALYAKSAEGSLEQSLFRLLERSLFTELDLNRQGEANKLESSELVLLEHAEEIYSYVAEQVLPTWPSRAKDKIKRAYRETKQHLDDPDEMLLAAMTQDASVKPAIFQDSSSIEKALDAWQGDDAVTRQFIHNLFNVFKALEPVHRYLQRVRLKLSAQDSPPQQQAEPFSVEGLVQYAKKALIEKTENTTVAAFDFANYYSHKFFNAGHKLYSQGIQKIGLAGYSLAFKEAVEMVGLLLSDKIQLVKSRILALPRCTSMLEKSVEQLDELNTCFREIRETRRVLPTSALARQLDRRLAQELAHLNEERQKLAITLEAYLLPLEQLASHPEKLQNQIKCLLKQYKGDDEREVIPREDKFYCVLHEKVETLSGIASRVISEAHRSSRLGDKGDGEQRKAEITHLLSMLRTLKCDLKKHFAQVTSSALFKGYTLDERLARGLVMLSEEVKQRYLAEIPIEKQAAACRRFNEVFLSVVMKENVLLQNLSSAKERDSSTILISEVFLWEVIKENVRLGNLGSAEERDFLTRLILALDNAEKGIVFSPPSADELLTRNETILGGMDKTAERRLLSAGISSAFNGACKLVASPAALVTRPIWRGGMFMYRLKRDRKAFKQSVAYRQSSSRRRKSQAIRRRGKTTIFKMTAGFFPGPSAALASLHIGRRLQKDKNYTAIKLGKSLARELPEALLMRGTGYVGCRVFHFCMRKTVYTLLNNIALVRAKRLRAEKIAEIKKQYLASLPEEMREVAGELFDAYVQERETQGKSTAQASGTSGMIQDTSSDREGHVRRDVSSAAPKEIGADRLAEKEPKNFYDRAGWEARNLAPHYMRTPEYRSIFDPVIDELDASVVKGGKGWRIHPVEFMTRLCEKLLILLKIVGPGPDHFQYKNIIDELKSSILYYAQEHSPELAIEYEKRIKALGERLDALKLTMSDYSAQARSLIAQAIEKTYTGNRNSDSKTFKQALLQELIQIFTKNSKDISLGLQLLQAINVVAGGEDVEVVGEGILLEMVNQDPSTAETYSHLLNEKVSNTEAYEDAVTKSLGGKGLRGETEAALRAYRKFADKKSAQLKAEISRLEGEIQKNRGYLKKWYGPDFTRGVTLEKVSKTIEDLQCKLRNVKEAQVRLSQYEKALAEQEKAFAKLESKFKLKALEKLYTEGIALTDSYVKHLPLTHEEYDKLYFVLLQEEHKALGALKPGDTSGRANITEKFRAAKLHLSEIYASSQFVQGVVNHVQTDIKDIKMEPDTSPKPTNDYRDILSAEETARKIYTQHLSHYETDATDGETGNTFNETETYIAAVIFYKARKGVSYDEIKSVSAHEILKYYLEHKRDEFPFKYGVTKPPSYYSFDNFKERSKFNCQKAYIEQFNEYIDKFMAYDVEAYVKYVVLTQQIPLSSLLSPPKVIYEYYAWTETGSKLSASEKDKISAIQLVDGNWLLMIELKGRMKTVYVKSDEVANSPFKPFIKPELLGKHKVKVMGLDTWATEQGDPNIYPPDGIARSDLDAYRDGFRKLGYKLEETPVLQRHTVSSNTYSRATALTYIKGFVEDNYKQGIDTLKVNMDKTGFWYHLAAIFIPFFDVIYKSVTDRYYHLTPQDRLSIVLDTLAIGTVLSSLGIKAAEMSEEFLLKIGMNYGEHIAAGVEPAEALKLVLAEVPGVVAGLDYPGLVKAARRELINLLNPLPVDIMSATCGLYRFSVKKFSGAAKGAKKVFNRLSTKLNSAWRVKDQRVIDEIEMKGLLKDDIYHVDGATNNLSTDFIKQGEDYYPVVADSSKQHWYVINPVAGKAAVKAGDTVLSRPIFRNSGEWSVSPFFEDRPNTANDSGTPKEISVDYNNFGRVMVDHWRSFKRTEHFSIESNKYIKDESYTVVPIGVDKPNVKPLKLDKSAALSILREAKARGDVVLARWNRLSAAVKSQVPEATRKNIASIENSVTIIQHTINSLEAPGSNQMFFALVKKGEDGRVIPGRLYGIAEMTYDWKEQKLVFNGLTAHPYTIVAKDPFLTNLLTHNPAGGASTTAINFDEYNIKNVAEHLGSSSLRQAVVSSPGEVKVVVDHKIRTRV